MKIVVVGLHAGATPKQNRQPKTKALPQGHWRGQDGHTQIFDDTDSAVVPQCDHAVVFAVGDFEFRQAMTHAPLLNGYLINFVASASGEDFDGAAGVDPVAHPLEHLRNWRTNDVGITGVAGLG